jgi:hypothetical protein
VLGRLCGQQRLLRHYAEPVMATGIREREREREKEEEEEEKKARVAR